MNTFTLSRGILHELGVMLATVLTTLGAGWAVDRITDDVALGTTYIGWGTGAGTSAVGDTTLFTEAGEGRVSAVISQPSANIIQWVGTITSSGAKTITNAGVFTAPTAGTLIVKSDFTGRQLLSAGESITFTVQLTLS